MEVITKTKTTMYTPNEVINISIDEYILREIIADCIDVSIRRQERFVEMCPGWDKNELAGEYLKEIIDEAVENSGRTPRGSMVHINTTAVKLRAVMKDCIDTAIQADKEMKASGRGWSRAGLGMTYINDIRNINKPKK